MAGGHTTQGTVLNGHGIRKVENQWYRLNIKENFKIGEKKSLRWTEHNI